MSPAQNQQCGPKTKVHFCCQGIVQQEGLLSQPGTKNAPTTTLKMYVLKGTFLACFSHLDPLGLS